MYPNSNAELKQRAREAFARNPAVILLASLLAALPGLLQQVMFSRGLVKMQAALLVADITRLTEEQILQYYRLAWPDARIGLVFGLLGILCAFLTVSQWHIALKLLRGEEAAGLLKANHLMPSMTADFINEALFDEIGDTVVACEDDRLTLVEDYREDLAQLLGGTGDGGA